MAKLLQLFGSPIRQDLFRKVRLLVEERASEIEGKRPGDHGHFDDPQLIVMVHELMSATEKNQGYSADVRMQLRVNGHTFLIGHLGPSFIILDNPADLPPAQAEITMSIDGHVKRWQVQLPDGVSAEKPRTRIQNCA